MATEDKLEGFDTLALFHGISHMSDISARKYNDFKEAAYIKSISGKIVLNNNQLHFLNSDDSFIVWVSMEQYKFEIMTNPGKFGNDSNAISKLMSSCSKIQKIVEKKCSDRVRKYKADLALA